MCIKGQVVVNPVSLDGCSAYLLKEQDKVYLVFTRGIQSAKDNIFIHKGQKIKIRGKGIINVDGVILPDEEKIDIQKMQYRQI